MLSFCFEVAEAERLRTGSELYWEGRNFFWEEGFELEEREWEGEEVDI